MRERLFRGKAINRDPNRHYRTEYKNGDWVFGLLSKYDKYGAEMTNEDGVSGIDVDIETVEDYAGIHDKNGARVFEGDICKNGLGEVMIVEWCKEYHTLGYKVIVDEIVKTKKTGKRFYGGWYLLFDCEPHNIEVIGNIYDNPELLEDIVCE